ncbi:TerL [Methylibium sp. Pch-M]|uniref:TerL n=1 Tax=Methylibium sp. Pch-M TaxID=2082386 RepID=UPI001012814B|nr:TerL [Methylibium sp. Pch-M]QAZ38441.1 TerL [Methylibium sp. Pch-M]
MRTIAYNPSPTLAEFHASNKFVRGIRGPIGSGKSVGCCWEIWTRAMEQAPCQGVRRSRWVATRNTYGELTTTTLQTWLDWFPEDRFGKVVHGAPITHTLRWPHADGTMVELEMWFLALDRPEHVKKLLSLEVTGGWMNEAREQPKAILDALTGRVGRYPSKRDGGASWFGVIMDTNPPDSDHWWYDLAEEQHPADFEFFSQPSGDGPNAENVENLPERYYERLKAGKTAEWIKVYVKGDYGYVTDGRPVYPEFVDSLHVAEFDLDPKLPLYGGMDFGLTPAGLFAQRRPNGQILIHSELVTDDMGIVRFAELWHVAAQARYPGMEFARITGDPAGMSRNDDERTTFDILRANRVPAVPASTNDFTLRREAFALPMTRLVDGKPRILVHPQCRRLRKALAGGYQYKRVAVSGAERFHDKPDKNLHSHVAEAGQYLVLGMGEGQAVKRAPDFNAANRQRVANGDYNVLG